MLYRLLFSSLLRRLDAETVHHATLRLLGWLDHAPVRAVLRRVLGRHDPILRTRVFGIDFPSPLGLAAGFDKDARAHQVLGAFGFGFVEVGTVTGQPQPGNPRPRMFRLPADRALVNRMGFNNAGSAVAARRLARRRDSVVGVNIGRTKAVPTEQATDDYVTSTRRLGPVADYLVINVSSPNTPGLRDLQAVEHLRPLIQAVQHAAPEGLPILVKIAPDLADADIDAVADLAVELGLAGIIATNTTISRQGLTSPAPLRDEPGGLSGAPLRARSLEVLTRLHQRVGDRVVVISVGGIEDAQDVWERIVAGAALVQAYTGLIYGGPLWPARVSRGLARLVREHGFATVADAVGTAT